MIFLALHTLLWYYILALCRCANSGVNVSSLNGQSSAGVPGMNVSQNMEEMKLMTEGMLKENRPVFNVGDTVRVSVRIKEGERERIQAFEGTVIAKRHGGIQETFTVRRSSYGVGVERVFPVNSPFVEKVEVVRKGKVRRAKLFYLRNRTGKAAKVKEQL